MAKVVKMQKDKKKELIHKQDLPPRPATLGDPIENIDWSDKHGRLIEYYTRVVNQPNKGNMAYVYRPNPGMIFRLDIVNKFDNHILPFIATIDISKNVIIEYIVAGSVQFIQFYEVKESDRPIEEGKDTE